VTWTVAIIEVGVLPDCQLAAYVPGAPADATLDLPCFCWLLRDPGVAVLVDTGPDARPEEDVGYEVAGDTRAALPLGLRAAGVTPGEITTIVHTHLHQDHVQNDALFANAEVVVQRRELEAALDGEARCRGLTAGKRAALAAGPYAASQGAGLWYVGAAALVARLGARVRLVDGEAEILPGVTVTPNGGHTAGHQSVLVDTADGCACIAGDIVSLAANADVVGPMTPDAAAASAFLERARAAGWEIIPSHEPAMRSHRWYASAR
jgi:N-acyl homoserine lactone hydrolase